MCEVFNGKLVGGRDKAIISTLEFARAYLMKRIVNVNKMIEKCDGPLTPTATKLLKLNCDEANKYTVTWGGGVQYEVSGPWRDQCVVNVEQMTCTCRKWELTGIPCKHAIATNWNMALNQQSSGIPEDWVHPCYRYESINSFTLHVACLLMHFHFVGWKHGRKLTQTRSHLLEVQCIGLSVLYQLLCYHQLITHKLGDQERKGESLGQRKIWCIYPRMAS